MSKYYLLATALLFNVINLIAQIDSTHVRELAEVVVTGQYQQQSSANSVYQVRTITKDRILKQGATKLQDVLNTELNIRFSQDLATGGSNMDLMGLAGQNVKVLLDGVPLTGRQGTSNEININQIDIYSIERIEIIEGPMSVIYGADALAGVINIITTKPGKETLYIKGRIQEESSGSEYGLGQGIHNQYAEAGWSKNKWTISGGVGRNYFGGWKGSAEGRELEWHKKVQVPGNFTVGYHDTGWSLYYRFNLMNEVISNPGIFSNDEAIDQDYISLRLMHRLHSSVNISNKLSFQGIASYSDYKREIYSTTVKGNGERRLALGAGMQDLTSYKAMVLRGTLLYKLSPKISVQPGYDLNIEQGGGERFKDGIQSINDYAVFVSAEIMPVSGVKIRPGVRFAGNSVYKAPPAVPSLNTKFSISDRLDLRLAYARGFRAPSLRELFFYFFDASHQIEGNTDLKAETSSSFTGSLDWRVVKDGQLSLTTSVSGFYNNIHNLITVGQSATNATVFTYLNVAKYKTRGMAITNKLKYRHLSGSLGLAYTGRYNDYSEADPSLPQFKWSTEINSSLSYQFTKPTLALNLFYKYTGKLPSYEVATVNNQQQVRLVETAGYHWADFSLSKPLFKYLTLNAGVRNLFNVTRIRNTAAGEGAHTESGARPIGYGRSFFAGLLFNWTKEN